MALSDIAHEMLNEAANGSGSKQGLIEISQVGFGEKANFIYAAGDIIASSEYDGITHKDYLEFNEVAMRLTLAGLVDHEPGDTDVKRYRLTLRGYKAAGDSDYDFSGLDLSRD